MGWGFGGWVGGRGGMRVRDGWMDGWMDGAMDDGLMLTRCACGREMAIGNTFGATALSSYGGFWISFAIVLTPGGFDIVSSIEGEGGAAAFYNSFGFFLMVSRFLLLVSALRLGAGESDG